MAKSRTGRPPKRAGALRTHTRSFRLDSELARQLEEAARIAHRTVSDEIAFRLESTFQNSPTREGMIALANKLMARGEPDVTVEGQYKGKPARIDVWTRPLPPPSPEEEAKLRAESAEMDEIFNPKKGRAPGYHPQD
jgi:hypothetical protein